MAMKLQRTLASYEGCTAYAVSSGSPAQMAHFVTDAKADISTLAAVNAEMLEALKGLDAYWTADFPKGPDGPRTVMHGLGEVSEDTMQVWRNVRAAIAKAEGQS